MVRYIVAILAMVLIAAPAAAQNNDKPVVGIAEMQDLTGSAQAENFIAMIETAIIGSGKFRIIERARLATLLKEQGLGRGGMVTTNTKKKTGGFEGVDYLIYGTITSISAVNKSNIGATMLGGLLGGNRSQQSECFNTKVRMEADIRITDTNSGEVRYATRISEEQESATVCGGGSQIDSAGLMRGSADKVATGLVTTIFPIQVAAIQGDGTVILNYGAGAVKRGDFLMIYGETTEIPDPSGNGTIKIDGEKIGAIQISDVQTAFSRAVQVTPFAVPLTVGTVARPVEASVVKELQKTSKKRR